MVELRQDEEMNGQTCPSLPCAVIHTEPGKSIKAQKCGAIEQKNTPKDDSGS